MNNSKQTTCPIEFMSGEFGGRFSNALQPERGNQYIAPVYYPTINQNDLLIGYDSKLKYEYEKVEVELYKRGRELGQKEIYEQRLKELRIQYESYMKLMSCTVYQDSKGDIIFAINNPENKSILSKQLLNVKGFKAEIYVSYYPDIQTVLKISWGDTERKVIYFDNTDDGIDTNAFLKKLHAKGVLFLVSGRTEKKAATALLAYIYKEAKRVEISSMYGWIKTSEGKWHFATKSEITMREVLKNVR